MKTVENHHHAPNKQTYFKEFSISYARFLCIYIYHLEIAGQWPTERNLQKVGPSNYVLSYRKMHEYNINIKHNAVFLKRSLYAFIHIKKMCNHLPCCWT